jgi:hypothetical protein
MSPEFRASLSGDGDEETPANQKRPIDYSRFQYSNTNRRKLRSKKKPLPSGMHNRHNKRAGW